MNTYRRAVKIGDSASSVVSGIDHSGAEYVVGSVAPSNSSGTFYAVGKGAHENESYDQFHFRFCFVFFRFGHRTHTASEWRCDSNWIKAAVAALSYLYTACTRAGC